MTKVISYILLLASVNLFAQSFSISGEMKNVPDNQYIYLHHKWDGKDYTDSAKVKSSKFSFTGKVLEPNMYWITKTT